MTELTFQEKLKLSQDYKTYSKNDFIESIKDLDEDDAYARLVFFLEIASLDEKRKKELCSKMTHTSASWYKKKYGSAQTVLSYLNDIDAIGIKRAQLERESLARERESQIDTGQAIKEGLGGFLSFLGKIADARSRSGR